MFYKKINDVVINSERTKATIYYESGIVEIDFKDYGFIDLKHFMAWINEQQEMYLKYGRKISA